MDGSKGAIIKAYVLCQNKNDNTVHVVTRGVWLQVNLSNQSGYHTLLATYNTKAEAVAAQRANW